MAGCSEDCELEVHFCNPLNNVPCSDTQKCSWGILPASEPSVAYFTCQMLAEDPLQNDEGDCFVGNDAQDTQCDIGLACYLGTLLDDCNVGGGCCTEYCDTALGAKQCSGAGDDCFAEPDLVPGLPNLGVCR